MPWAMHGSCSCASCLVRELVPKGAALRLSHVRLLDISGV